MSCFYAKFLLDRWDLTSDYNILDLMSLRALNCFSLIELLGVSHYSPPICFIIIRIGGGGGIGYLTTKRGGGGDIMGMTRTFWAAEIDGR